MFGAGSETTATIIDWAMAELLKNPSIVEKAQEEVRGVFNEKGYVDETYFDNLTYLKSVIKETLRLHLPLPFLHPRISREKCEINGYEIPAQTQVFVNACAIGRDPRYWEEPECFKLERFLDSSINFSGNNFEYIRFGAGRRLCRGVSFGLATLELPLAFLLYRFDWNLPIGMSHQDLDMTETIRFGAGRRLCRGVSFGLATLELPLAFLLYHFDWKLPIGMSHQDLDMTETFGLSVTGKLDLYAIPIASKPITV